MSFWKAFFGDNSYMDWYQAEQAAAASQSSTTTTTATTSQPSGQSHIQTHSDHPYHKTVHGIDVYAENQSGLNRGIQVVEDWAKDPDVREHWGRVRYVHMLARPLCGNGASADGLAPSGGVVLRTGMPYERTRLIAKHEYGHNIFGRSERLADEFAGIPHNPNNWDPENYS